MEFSLEIIKKVATFAKIKLSDEEAELFNQEFSAIAAIINKLQKVDTTHITPIHNPSPAHLVLREDVASDGNYAEQILSNAPKHAFNCFVVPKVVE